MLGATTAGARTRGAVSVPPNMAELTKTGQRDWKTGVELLEGCMVTHQTATQVAFLDVIVCSLLTTPFSSGLSPEIVQFQPSADQPNRDWYIKGSKCVSSSVRRSDNDNYSGPVDRLLTMHDTCFGRLIFNSDIVSVAHLIGMH
jgi:hypothetical protein